VSPRVERGLQFLEFEPARQNWTKLGRRLAAVEAGRAPNPEGNCVSLPLARLESASLPVKPPEALRSLMGRLKAALGASLEPDCDALAASYDALLAGEPRGTNTLFELTYQDLRDRAAALLRQERRSHTLQATALVNEIWMRLVRGEQRRLRGRAQFLAIAARAMRQVLIDHARKRNAQKRGEGRREPLHSEIEIAPQVHVDGFDLAEALEELEGRHAREGRVATEHLLGGLTLEEIAGLLDLSHDTIRDDWRFARNWLNRRLKGMEPA
jgi:RNA polymerase sigma-70 factor, ECF subfamily